MRHFCLAVTVPALMALSGAAPCADSQTASAPALINACVGKLIGLPRLVSGPKACTPFETFTQWYQLAVPGLSGAQGPQGIAGLYGPAGAMGASGPAGATGVAGMAGPKGVTGAQGATGPAGPVGASGSAGTNGSAGATGATGATGAMGPLGASGPIGPTGPAGPIGATGPAGPDGPAGVTGLATNGLLYQTSVDVATPITSYKGVMSQYVYFLTPGGQGGIATIDPNVNTGFDGDPTVHFTTTPSACTVSTLTVTATIDPPNTVSTDPAAYVSLQVYKNGAGSNLACNASLGVSPTSCSISGANGFTVVPGDQLSLSVTSVLPVSVGSTIICQ